MAFFLSIDASTHGCSVAVSENDKVLSCFDSYSERTAAEFLTTMIEQCLAVAGITMGDLDAIAVGKGPGSYTGLRIAVSTAKGLAVALEKPLISFNSLEALARGVNFTESIDLICPMIDARRMEVFTAMFETKSKNIYLETQALIVDENSFFDILKDKKILFVGNGSQKIKHMITHPHAHFLDKDLHLTASFASDIIFQKFLEKNFEDIVSFEPFYLKEYMFKTKKD